MYLSITIFKSIIPVVSVKWDSHRCILYLLTYATVY